MAGFHVFSGKKNEDAAFSILLIGTDGGAVRELMNVRADEQAGVITLRSLRPLFPGGDFGELDVCLRDGGAPLLTSAVSRRLGRDVGQYLQFSFRNVMEAVDHVGGVSLALSAEELAGVNGQIEALCRDMHLPPEVSLLGPEAGLIRLSGLQTAAFLMGPSGDNPAYRWKRFLSALKTPVKSAGPGKLIGLADLVLPALHTNIPRSVILSRLLNIRQLLRCRLIIE